MSVTEFFRSPRVRRRMYAGPLSPYIDSFTEHLARLGYSKRSICTNVRLTAGVIVKSGVQPSGGEPV